jgi:2-dehydro-3-deoxyphosphogluconate aldolase / (4S)-4-hydroxy-2-oxoglutarate aldolase
MISQLPEDLSKRIERCGVIAVLVIDDAKHAVPLARALVAGGVDVMELTLRTPAALEALRRVRAEVREMLAGIGTVLTPQQVEEVAKLKAAFAVSPGTNPRVIAAARERDLPFMPGVATPSDIEAALELGCRDLKFFPAEACGGLAYLKNMAAPYAHLGVRFVPLGGLTTKNLKDYLAEPSIMAVGGSWLTPRPLIQAEAWDKITANASEARSIASAARPVR